MIKWILKKFGYVKIDCSYEHGRYCMSFNDLPAYEVGIGDEQVVRLGRLLFDECQLTWDDQPDRKVLRPPARLIKQ